MADIWRPMGFYFLFVPENRFRVSVPQTKQAQWHLVVCKTNISKFFKSGSNVLQHLTDFNNKHQNQILTYLIVMVDLYVCVVMRCSSLYTRSDTMCWRRVLHKSETRLRSSVLLQISSLGSQSDRQAEDVVTYDGKNKMFFFFFYMGFTDNKSTEYWQPYCLKMLTASVPNVLNFRFLQLTICYYCKLQSEEIRVSAYSNFLSITLTSACIYYNLYCLNIFLTHRPLMKKKLEQGTTLVVDRYAFSGVAFTSAKPVSHFPAF